MQNYALKCGRMCMYEQERNERERARWSDGELARKKNNIEFDARVHISGYRWIYRTKHEVQKITKRIYVIVFMHRKTNQLVI